MINRLEPNLTGKQKEMVKFRYKYRSKQEKETWWKRYNYELYEIFNELNIVNHINPMALEQDI